jgi:hypothetical protein
MKKYFTFVAFATAYICSAQQLPQSLSVAVNTSNIGQGLKPTITPTLSYYGKNYTEVFGKYNYTSDPLDFGDRNIYVQSDTRLYNNLNNRFQMDMPLAGIDVNSGFYNYSFVEFTAAVLSTWGADNLNYVFNKQ